LNQNFISGLRLWSELSKPRSCRQWRNIMRSSKPIGMSLKE
jgi:hypothetical protein